MADCNWSALPAWQVWGDDHASQGRSHEKSHNHVTLINPFAYHFLGELGGTNRFTT
jgi:hypothetical protein